MIKELQKKLLGKDTYDEQMIEALKRYIREQQKEIERLNKECDTYMGVATRKERRIRKAIEYIKEHSTTIDYKTMKANYNLNMNDLLDILKGSDK